MTYTVDKLIITTSEFPITSVPEGYILYDYDKGEILTELPNIFQTSGSTEPYTVEIRFPIKGVKGSEEIVVAGKKENCLRHYLYTDLTQKAGLENSYAYVDGKTYLSQKGEWVENKIKNKK